MKTLQEKIQDYRAQEERVKHMRLRVTPRERAHIDAVRRLKVMNLRRHHSRVLAMYVIGSRFAYDLVRAEGWECEQPVDRNGTSRWVHPGAPTLSLVLLSSNRLRENGLGQNAVTLGDILV